MKTILIVIILNNSFIVTQEFDTFQTCKNAMEIIKSSVPKDAIITCVNK